MCETVYQKVCVDGYKAVLEPFAQVNTLRSAGAV